MVGITFDTSLPLISIWSFIFFSSVFLSTSAAQELLNPSNDGGEVFVHPPKHRYIPVLFTGPFNRRSIPLSAAAAAAVVTSHEEQHQQPPSSYLNTKEEGNEDSYVVQKLFSNTNSNTLQPRNNGAPLYPVVFSRKPNKVWAPVSIINVINDKKAYPPILSA
uniref:Uncharacterized protein n=1 Tax=Panagrolaimus sp. ES5 TaxID=591445 RepID=A0AC34GB28_9BILA